jgi:hypothetical protein
MTGGSRITGGKRWLSLVDFPYVGSLHDLPKTARLRGMPITIAFRGDFEKGF